MIEEAAGTSMFEEKKDKAVKTMARKEKRLDEIKELLREEITPKLDKLREEKRAFLEFQKKSSELERLSKLVVAYDWTQLEARKEKGLELVRESERKMKEATSGRGRMDGEISRMEKEVVDIQKRRDKVSRTLPPTHEDKLTLTHLSGARQGRKGPKARGAADRARQRVQQARSSDRHHDRQPQGGADSYRGSRDRCQRG